MALFISYLLLSILGGVKSIGTESELKQLIVDNIGKVCPEADICGVKKQRIPKPGYTSCCADCSCEEDCFLTNSCCFPPEDADVKTSQCTSMVYPPPAREEEHKFAAYRVVTHSPANGCVNGEEYKPYATILPWGNLYPVYSKVMKEIYVNQNLADCYGITDGTDFDVTLLCETFMQNELTKYDISYHLSGLYSFNLTSHCKVGFQYKGDERDLKIQRCIINPFDNCNNATFESEHTSYIPSVDIERLCKSNFYSPSIGNGYFKNIFCQLCSGFGMISTRACSIFDGIKSLEVQALSFLLDPRLLKSLTTRMSGEKETKSSCHMVDDRILLCPDAMIRSSTGVCVYPKVRLHSGEFSITLKLSLDRPLPTRDITQKDTNTLPSWLRSPWPNRWRLLRIYYETPVQNNEIDHLYAEILSKVYNDRLESFLKGVKKQMYHTWEGSLSKENYTFKQYFSKFGARNYDEGLFSITRVDGLNISKIPITMIYESNKYSVYAFRINKMFYCQQIQLELHEIELDIKRTNEKILTVANVSRRTIYLEDEFHVRMQQDGRRVVSICLEEYNGQRCSSSNKLPTLLWMYIYIACLSVSWTSIFRVVYVTLKY